ncbi:hypothetical protein ACWGKW_12350 [Streptomyces sp. NPDC054766]
MADLATCTCGTGTARTVEQHASEDTDTWDGEESRLWTDWDDGTSGGRIELADFLTTAGLRPAPAAEAC